MLFQKNIFPPKLKFSCACKVFIFTNIRLVKSIIPVEGVIHTFAILLPECESCFESYRYRMSASGTKQPLKLTHKPKIKEPL